MRRIIAVIAMLAGLLIVPAAAPPDSLIGPGPAAAENIQSCAHGTQYHWFSGSTNYLGAFNSRTWTGSGYIIKHYHYVRHNHTAYGENHTYLVQCPAHMVGDPSGGTW